MLGIVNIKSCKCDWGHIWCANTY